MSESPQAAFDLSKLPPIDKADLQAVRSFLPGKLLGRTAALLSLVLMVLAWAALTNVALDNFFQLGRQPGWLRNGLLFGVPLLIVACQLAVEWQAARNQHRARQLALKTDAHDGGYFRIGPYLDTPEDLARFDRADQAHKKLLDWLLNASALPLYITGDSGTGKSSLLNAFVRPSCGRGNGWSSRRGPGKIRRRLCATGWRSSHPPGGGKTASRLACVS